MYNVYLNDILLDEDDVINIIENIKFTIIREDGFDNTEQILREKSEAEVSFTGRAYADICALLIANPCSIIKIRIEKCSLIFNGTIDIGIMERTMGAQKCICKTKIKDASFSSYIRDYLAVSLALYNTKTKNCAKINTPQINILMSTDPAVPATRSSIIAFDVLDVFKYMIGYFTDNTITVKSDFLTTNKYAITTGFNMHSHGISIDQIYPTLTFQDLFLEVRKKLRIYMGIEYDVGGGVYLRIENEEYFFEDTELFSIDELPPNTVQTYDTKRDFQQIDIGSDTTKMNGGFVYYPQLRFVAFNKESYGGCGNCTGDKDSKLDLVSKYIIDSNVIYEALVFGAGDYANDDAIFLFNYYRLSGVNYGKVELDISSARYFYNETLTNENILQNWIDYYGKCLSIQRNSKYGFYTKVQDYIMSFRNFAADFSCGDNEIIFNSTLYDNLSSISVGNDATFVHCYAIPGAGPVTQFLCQESGTFNFQAKVINLVHTSGTPPSANSFELHIRVYSDAAFTALLGDYSETATADPSQTVNITVQTDNIHVGVGNVVIVYFVMNASINNDGTFTGDYTFELISDDFSCHSLDYNNQNSRPYILDIKDEFCIENYLKANKNKKGFIRVAGTKQWIKEVTMDGKNTGAFKLMGNDLICGC